MSDDSEIWALEAAPPTAAEATDEGRALLAQMPESGLVTRIWSVEGGVAEAPGWVRVTSRAGGFSVDLPGAYNDISHYYAEQKIAFAAHLLRATLNGVKYGASRDHVRGGGRMPGWNGAPVLDPIARMRRAWERDPNTKAIRDVICTGGFGCDHESAFPPGSVSRTRVFDCGERGMYSLSVQGSPEAVSANRIDIDRFLNSFEP